MGEKRIWGSSLVFNHDKRVGRICGNLLPKVPSNSSKVFKATFTQPFGGSVLFQTLKTGERVETNILTNLHHHEDSQAVSKHKWEIFITESLPSERKRRNCNFLNIKLDPNNKIEGNCSISNPSGCKDG